MSKWYLVTFFSSDYKKWDSNNLPTLKPEVLSVLEGWNWNYEYQGPHFIVIQAWLSDDQIVTLKLSITDHIRFMERAKDE